MVISRVDRNILKSVAEMDGIRCGLLEIVQNSGCDYRNAHRRLHRLERAGLIRVDRRGRGRRLIITLRDAALLLTVGAGYARGGVPVYLQAGLQNTESKYDQ